MRQVDTFEFDAPPGAPEGLALFQVGTLDSGWLEVQAPDWLSALGIALRRLGLTSGIRRMACEVLANGDVIVNDLTHTRRFTVKMLCELSEEDLPDPDDEPTEVVIAVPAG